MVRRTVDVIRPKVEAGIALEDLIAEGLPEEWRSWETPLVPESQWIAMIYASITGENVWVHLAD